MGYIRAIAFEFIKSSMRNWFTDDYHKRMLLTFLKGLLETSKLFLYFSGGCIPNNIYAVGLIASDLKRALSQA